MIKKTYSNIAFTVSYMHKMRKRKYMRVNNGISLLWDVICGIWSLMWYKPRGDFSLVVNLVKNESTMFFTIFICYMWYMEFNGV